MSFTSLEFAVFFALFFVLYWFVFQRSLKKQNLLILVSSYIFYGWWDWRFLVLIFISSLADFLIGKAMTHTTEKQVRKRLLFLSLGVNFGILGFFKYFGFFLENFKLLLPFLVPDEGFSTLDIILPVGISFYTLQTLSYTFDVYKNKIEATNNFVNFFAYVSFFPQLVAGPIERASNLLPQFAKAREFNYERATDGLRQVTWGLFKKMVVADNIGPPVTETLANYTAHDSSTLLLYLLLGTIEFYCDFSAYSDIAIGSARLLGFDLMKNFDYPFFSRNISELWQKWHISLISWFKDYVIIWLKGFSKPKLVRNIFIIFVITGLWHGAAWTYIVWGLLNALCFLPLIFGQRTKFRKPVAAGRLLPSAKEFFMMARTFFIFCLIGIFFRSASVADGFNFWYKLATPTLFTEPAWPSSLCLFTFVLFGVEWVQREQEHGLDLSKRNLPVALRWTIYFSLVAIILLFGGQANEFIYFQF